MRVVPVEPSATLVAMTYPVRRDGEGFVVDRGEPGESASPMARVVERSARVAWKSEGRMSLGSAGPFVQKIVQRNGHASVAEHASATVHFVTDRVTSHQIVRARIAAYTQESTHYLNYAKKGEVAVVVPIGLDTVDETAYLAACQVAADAYESLIAGGVRHYAARFALPMGLKTEVVATYNLRMWAHVLEQRTAPQNTPEIIHLMRLAGNELAAACPELFEQWKLDEPIAG